MILYMDVKGGPQMSISSHFCMRISYFERKMQCQTNGFHYSPLSKASVSRGRLYVKELSLRDCKGKHNQWFAEFGSHCEVERGNQIIQFIFSPRLP